MGGGISVLELCVIAQNLFALLGPLVEFRHSPAAHGQCVLNTLFLPTINYTHFLQARSLARQNYTSASLKEELTTLVLVFRSRRLQLFPCRHPYLSKTAIRYDLDKMSSPYRVPPLESPSNPRSRKREVFTSEAGSAADAGNRSLSLAIAMEQSLVLEAKLAEEVASVAPQTALQRMLSLRSIISTTSSFAQAQQTAVGKVTNFREIGKGSIGVVYEHPGTIRCYKLPLLDDPSKLWNNYTMQTAIQEAFAKARNSLDVAARIPEMFWYANDKTSGFWDENLSKFPFTTVFPEKPRHALCMERILPLPRPLRHLLVDQYCQSDKDEAKNYAPNQDCLVRPILGRRRFGSGSGRARFSLRNFRLHLDQFEELNLDAHEYIIAMADAMATLHFLAKVDAMDIEFVIGSTPSDMLSGGASLTIAEVSRMPLGTSTFEMVSAKDFTNREVCLWVLDFDACSPIEINPGGVQAAVKAFMGTEPYCPRPSNSSEDHQLWMSFGQRYTSTTTKLHGDGNFASGFLLGVENAVKDSRASRTPYAAPTQASNRGQGKSGGGSDGGSRGQTGGGVRGQSGGRGRGQPGGGGSGQSDGGSRGPGHKPSFRDLTNWRRPD
jgi:hypothetical protein